MKVFDRQYVLQFIVIIACIKEKQIKVIVSRYAGVNSQSGFQNISIWIKCMYVLVYGA